MREVVKKEIVKWLDESIIYPTSDSQWLSPTQVVPQKSGLTVVQNDLSELVPTRPPDGEFILIIENWMQWLEKTIFLSP